MGETKIRAASGVASHLGSESYHTNVTLTVNTSPPQVCSNPQGCISGGATQAGTPVPVSQRALVPQGTTYMAPEPRSNPYVANGVGWSIRATPATTR